MKVRELMVSQEGCWRNIAISVRRAKHSFLPVSFNPMLPPFDFVILCYRGRRMKPRATLLITLTLILCASAALANPARKPVSRYMRDTGILYLETAEGLTLDCGRKSPVDDDRMSRWEAMMDGLEDRVNITLSEPKRPEGDKPFWELLKAVRYARMFYVRAESDG